MDDTPLDKTTIIEAHTGDRQLLLHGRDCEDSYLHGYKFASRINFIFRILAILSAIGFVAFAANLKGVPTAACIITFAISLYFMMKSIKTMEESKQKWESFGYGRWRNARETFGDIAGVKIPDGTTVKSLQQLYLRHAGAHHCHILIARRVNNTATAGEHTTLKDILTDAARTLLGKHCPAPSEVEDCALTDFAVLAKP